jgi:hypothetical protein
MALSLVTPTIGATEDPVLAGLANVLAMSRPLTRELNDYYEGDHRLKMLGLAVPPELEMFNVPLAWPRLTVDALEQRLDVTGFRFPEQPADSYLWENWQFNNMDERQTFVHTDALALGRSYVCVGTNPEDAEHPIVTVESPQEMYAARDPRTHRVTAALRLYGGNPIIPGQDDRATLYLPNVTRWLIMDNGRWVDEVDPDVHNLGSPPVVPFVNRYRATRRTVSVVEGVSEMWDVIPIADSAARAITNAQLAQETHAVPQRGVLGATKGDFVDSNGQPLSTWDAYFGGVWAMGNPNAKTFQFDSSDMSNFETIVNMYARVAAGVTSLPIEYFGLNTQNAPSAEGQRAGEFKLIKKAERRQVSFGHSWESVQRLVLRFRDGVWDPDARSMESVWRDAGTPTLGMVADAVVKQYAANLTDWETAQEDLGRTPAQIEQMKRRRESDLAVAVGAGVQSALQSEAAVLGPVGG